MPAIWALHRGQQAALDAVGEDSSEAAAKVRAWQKRQAEFLEGKDLKRRYERENTTVFGYSQEASADKQANAIYKSWSKSIGVDSPIKTLAEYYDVKYNDSARYALLQTYIRSVQSGKMSPMVHFDLYEEYHTRIQNEIVGKTVNGITITGQSNHFLERVFGTMVDPEKLKYNLVIVRRSGVSYDAIVDALFKGVPESIKEKEKENNGVIRRSFKMICDKCAVSINPDTGILIQTNPY